MAQFKHQVDLEFAQEFFNTVRDKCIDTCVPRPGSSLSRGEQQCLAQCVARYQDATQTVGKAVLSAMGMQ
jgi:import inner membrane translocase subunit TIM13